MDKNKPKLCFVVRFLGQRSEVWLWRQIVGMTEFEPHVITWAYMNKTDYPLIGITVDQLPFEPAPENSTMVKRWLYRFRNLLSLNFYGTTGKEKAYIYQLLSDVKPQAILCHFGQTALRILPIAKELGVPLVAHFHGMDISSSLANKWYRWSLMCQVKQFAAIVVVGNHQKGWFLEHGIPESRINVIPCGVPTDEYVCKKYENETQKIRFMAVSRLVEKKGIEFTLKAFAIVKRENPEVTLDIFGDGPLENKLKEQVNNMELADAVSFKGSVPSDYVRKEMALYDIFVQHSIVTPAGDSEGSPVATAEAAASGLPVISTISPGMGEQVIDGKTGFLVEQKDFEMMAKAMSRLVKDKDLRESMGKAGREQMIKHFGTKQQIAKLEQVLLNCCRDYCTRE